MFDKNFIMEIIEQILASIKKIERRFININSSDDFLDSDEGLDMLDSICMQLIAIGESVKNIDKITHSRLLINYPEVDWKGVKGVRDIISHHYFDLDAEAIFNICDKKIEPLAQILNVVVNDLKKNK